MNTPKKTTPPARGRKPLRLALLVFFITITGIALIISIYYGLEQKEVKSTEEQLVLIARSAARNLENYLGGYLKDFDIIVSSPQFKDGMAECRSTGNSQTLVDFLNNYNVATGSNIGDIMITDPSGNIMVSTSANSPYTNCTDMLGTNSSMLVFSSRSGALYLGLSVPLEEGYRIMSMVNIEQMYTDTASSMDIGKKGYVMYKHSTGMIIMHPVKEQIGWDVLEDRKKAYPSYDFTDLEGLIARQKQGLSNVEIYNSYWWADETPRRVKKISAYCPAYVGNDFLIVSTVVDFNEVMAPLNFGLLLMGAVLLVLGITFSTMVLLLVRSIREQQGIERENLYLRDLNSSLEEMHRSEEKLRHFQRLETIGTLTGGIAHELNNMLTPIMAYSAMLMDEISPEDNRHQDAEEIFSASSKAKEVIQQISMISHKDSDVAFVRINVAGELARSLRMVNSIKPKTIKMAVSLELPPSCQMMGSATQLTQVFINLCTNAFQSMEPLGGTLTISAGIAPPDESELLPGTESLVIRFTDTGSGIEPRLLPRIFDPFFTTKKAGEGTGLGLSIVQSIVESHCGSIAVASTIGKGTEFTLRLPVNTQPAAEEVAGGALQHILLVDNDPKILHMLKRVLTVAGYHAVDFSTPIAAMEYLRSSNPVDMLITDFAMAQTSGLEVALFCRNLRAELPILLMTGFVNREVVEARRNAIISDYLIKPVHGRELLEIVAKQGSAISQKNSKAPEDFQ